MNKIDIGDGVEVTLINGAMVDSPEIDCFISECIVRHGKDREYHKKMLTAYAMSVTAMKDAESGTSHSLLN